MFVVMGSTGHVGSVVVDSLLADGHPVLALIHSADKAAALEARGAQTAVVDARDTDALRAAFQRGRRAFLLNPPADPSTDTDAEERATVAAILQALDGSGLEKVVAESTMGAQAGEALEPRTGDSSVLYEFEKGLVAQHVPAAINRAAYYFSNFDMQLDEIRDTGRFDTVFPADFVLPAVAPVDLGRAAARRLTSDLVPGSTRDIGVVDVEGPERLSFAQMAAVFARVLNRDVQVVAAPEDQLVEAFSGMGFSPQAADAYARMTRTALAHPAEPVGADTIRGEVTLEAYLRGLIDT